MYFLIDELIIIIIITKYVRNAQRNGRALCPARVYIKCRSRTSVHIELEKILGTIDILLYC